MYPISTPLPTPYPHSAVNHLHGVTPSCLASPREVPLQVLLTGTSLPSAFLSPGSAQKHSAELYPREAQGELGGGLGGASRQERVPQHRSHICNFVHCTRLMLPYQIVESGPGASPSLVVSNRSRCYRLSCARQQKGLSGQKRH